MDNRPIGVLDSGLGGLTAVKELHRRMPAEDVVFLGDTGRVPYGTRSKETILRYTAQDIAYLQRQNIKMLVVACGTISSNLEPGLLEKMGFQIPWIGVVQPAALAACEATRNGRVGLIATPATVRSGAFEKDIRALNPDIQVISQPCPLLVPLAENGMVQRDNPIARLALETYLSPLSAQGIDTLIMGCTHYPLFSPAIADLLGPGVALIDSGAEAAAGTQHFLESHGLRHEGSTSGSTRYCVTDTVETFAEVAGIFLGKSVMGQVEFVQLEEIPGG